MRQQALAAVLERVCGMWLESTQACHATMAVNSCLL